MVRPLVGGEEVSVDEIADFADVRSVGASEATWRIFGFEMGDRAPDVIGSQPISITCWTLSSRRPTSSLRVHRPRI